NSRVGMSQYQYWLCRLVLFQRLGNKFGLPTPCGCSYQSALNLKQIDCHSGPIHLNKSASNSTKVSSALAIFGPTISRAMASIAVTLLNQPLLALAAFARTLRSSSENLSAKAA